MIYRKQGSVVRWENGTVVRVTESGIAVEEGDLFRCWPASSEEAEFNVILSRGSVPTGEEAGGDGSSSGQPSHIEATAALLCQAFPNLTLERLLLTHGIAHHQYGDRTWSEETRRLHLALTKHRMRVLIDQTTFDTQQITRIADALAKAETTEQPPPPRLRLSPNVTAALLPSLVHLAPPNVRIFQTAGGIDGKGNEIVEAESNWPNWYRPSYRVRPVRMPFNLRIESDVTEIERERPEAIALLAPVEGTILRVLIEDGDRVYPGTVRVTRIDAVANERVLYPYGAGSFGAEMML